MDTLRFTLAVLVLCAALATPSARAGDNDPLFVNLTSDEAFLTMMAMRFAKSLWERGHPLTIFLNDKGIFLASKTRGA